MEQEHIDSKRLDWLDRNLLSISHHQMTHSVDMGGIRITGQLLNEARGDKGGPSRILIKGKNIRDVIDQAMNWSKK